MARTSLGTAINKASAQQIADDAARTRLDPHINNNDAHGLAQVRADILTNAASAALNGSLARAAFSTILNDTFDRADAATLGTPWIGTFNGILSISGNAAVSPNTTSNTVYGSLTLLGSPQQIVTAHADLTGASGEASLMLRAVDNANYMLVQLGVGGNITLYSIVANAYISLGAGSILGFAPTMPLNNALVTAYAIGSTLNLYVGNVLALTAIIPDALATGTQAGIRIINTGKMLDWSASAAGAASGGSSGVNTDEVKLARAMSRPMTAVALDGFNRADTASIGSADTGGAWSFLLNVLPKIASNKAKMGSNAVDMAILPALSTGNVIVKATINVPASGTISDAAGLVVRNGTPNRFTQVFRYGDGTIKVIRYNGSAYVTLGTFSAPVPGRDEVLSVVCWLGDLFVLLDGVLVGRVSQPDDPVIYKTVGIILSYQQATIDDFKVLALEVI